MRFSMDIRLTKEELKSMVALEQNCSKQISVVNDVYSWEKELLASQTGHREGSALCSAVKVLADSTGLNIEASKRVLMVMAREWENVHDRMVAEKSAAPGGCSPDAQAYMKGLEYQMSGNNQWSKTTLRYSDV
jgi:aristolochene synthase